MYKFIRVICALIISTLIMALAPVHAEESSTVEFTIGGEEIDHEGLGFTVGNGSTRIVLSGLEPNKTYNMETNDGIGTTVGHFTTDSDGGASILLGTIDSDRTITVKDVSKLSYFIDCPRIVSAYSRHRFDMEVYHNNALTETVVGERNKGIRSKTYTVNAGSKEKILLKNHVYKAFSSTIMGGIPNGKKLKYTAHITGLDPEDLVFFMPRIRTMTLVGGSVEDGAIAETRPTNGEVVYDFEIGSNNGDINTMEIYSIPAYARLVVTQHEVGPDWTPTYQTAVNGASDNTVPGIALSTPELGYVDTNTIQVVVFTQMQTQSVVVNKKVEGNQGNRHEQFEFHAKFVAESGTDYTGAVSISKNNGTVEQLIPDSNNVYTFILQHGDTVKLFGFEDMILTATITEADNDYQTKMAVNDGQPIDSRETTVNIGDTVNSIYSAYIQYTNSKSLIVPTGISLPVGGALFIIVGIGIIFISKKHKQVKVI